MTVDQIFSLMLKVRLEIATASDLKALQQWAEQKPERLELLKKAANPEWEAAALKVFNEPDVKAALAKVHKLINNQTLSHMVTFKAFELKIRDHAPNAIVGITGDDKRVFITAPASTLGKQLGDMIAQQIKAALEREHVRPTLKIRPIEAPQIECPECRHMQERSYPMTGKLHCRGCGALLDEIVA